MIRHILFIAFVSDITSENLDRVREGFLGIPAVVDGVLGVEWGVNDSLENKSAGYTHSVMMTFLDDSALHRYLRHPEHEKLKKIFRPFLRDIIVFYYPVKEQEHSGPPPVFDTTVS
ncbi:Dabb family protein [Enterobacter kobei]|uniref:Dabb family protein n=1 Tax=Enterobacter cloacae complex TaxID=354276 RepID=UPI003567A4E5